MATDPAPEKQPNGAAENGGAPSRRRIQKRTAIPAVLGLIAVLAGTWWFVTRNDESTDDAFIDGDVVDVAPRIAGKVSAVHFTDNQSVKAGDLLVELDPADFDAALARARAEFAAAEARGRSAAAQVALAHSSTDAVLEQARGGLAQAKAALEQRKAQLDGAVADEERARADMKRYRALSAGDYTSRQRLDTAQAEARRTAAAVRGARNAVDAGRADVARAEGTLHDADTAAQQLAVREAELAAATAAAQSARAAVRQAELSLSYTRVVAPHDGHIVRKNVSAGDVTLAGQKMAALVFGAPWVVANFKETQLGRMRPGQPVTITVDAYDGYTLRGHVDSVQRGTGAYFSLLPPENATGNYVKVVQRVPVKIVIDDSLDPARPLGLGMSVVPTVDVADGAPAKP